MRTMVSTRPVWLGVGLALLLVGCQEPKVSETPLDKAPPLPATANKPGNQPGPADKDASMEFTATESGLKYRILRKSDGAKPEASNSVTVHYRGWLDDGTEFDSSYARGETISFPLDGVIPGWTEGLQLVGKGGMIELEIPSELGYRNRAMGKIPANSRLHFIVELFDIK